LKAVEAQCPASRRSLGQPGLAASPKVILSRKGFDTGSGGCPSPVMPDGQMLSLPIPDPGSPITYGHTLVPGREASYYEVMTGLGIGTVTASGKRTPLTPDLGAHLDPDLVAASRSRQEGWLPSLGQVGSSQSHLRKKDVRPGDLMLFFGLFRHTVGRAGRLVPTGRRFHAVWGWLEIGGIFDVKHDVPAWATDHPHVVARGLARYQVGDNVLYTASRACYWAGGALPGGGVLDWSRQRLLTDGERCSTWRLPAAFHPEATTSPLSYHGKPERWTHDGPHVLLDTRRSRPGVRGRGQ